MVEGARIPASASLAVLPEVARPMRSARVVGLHANALYLDDGQVTIGIVTRDAVRLPNSLVVAASRRDQPFANIRPDAATTVGNGRVTVGPLTFIPSRTWDPRPLLRIPPRRILDKQIQQLTRLLADQPCGITLHLQMAEAVARADAATAIAAAAHLVGLGPGLTPSGDDVLAGAIAALRLLGADENFTDSLAEGVVSIARDRTTGLAATLLASAARGDVCAEVADVMRGLTDEQPLRPAVARLLRVGHTSGTDLAHGVLLGARAASHHTSMRRDSA